MKTMLLFFKPDLNRNSLILPTGYSIALITACEKPLQMKARSKRFFCWSGQMKLPS